MASWCPKSQLYLIVHALQIRSDIHTKYVPVYFGHHLIGLDASQSDAHQLNVSLFQTMEESSY